MPKYRVVCEPFSLPTLAAVLSSNDPNIHVDNQYACWVLISDTITFDDIHIAKCVKEGKNPIILKYSALQYKKFQTTLFQSSGKKYLIVFDNLYNFLTHTTKDDSLHKSECTFIVFAPYGYITQPDLLLIKNRFTGKTDSSDNKEKRITVRTNTFFKTLPKHIIAYLCVLFVVANFKRVFRLFGKHRRHRTLRGRYGGAHLTQKSIRQRRATRHAHTQTQIQNIRTRRRGGLFIDPLTASASSAFFLLWFTNTISISAVIEKLLNFIFDLPYAVWDGVHRFGKHFAHKHPRKNKVVQGMMETMDQWNVSLGHAANKMTQARYYRTSTLRSVSTNVYHKVQRVFQLLWGESGQEAFIIAAIAILTYAINHALAARISYMHAKEVDEEIQKMEDNDERPIKIKKGASPKEKITHHDINIIKSIPIQPIEPVQNESMVESSQNALKIIKESNNAEQCIFDMRNLHKKDREAYFEKNCKADILYVLPVENKKLLFYYFTNKQLHTYKSSSENTILDSDENIDNIELFLKKKKKIKEVCFIHPPTYEEFLHVRTKFMGRLILDLGSGNKIELKLSDNSKQWLKYFLNNLPVFSEYVTTTSEHAFTSIFKWTKRNLSADEIFINYRNKSNIIRRFNKIDVRITTSNFCDKLPIYDDHNEIRQALLKIIINDPQQSDEQKLVHHIIQAKKLKKNLYEKELSHSKGGGEELNKDDLELLDALKKSHKNKFTKLMCNRFTREQLEAFYKAAMGPKYNSKGKTDELLVRIIYNRISPTFGLISGGLIGAAIGGVVSKVKSSIFNHTEFEKKNNKYIGLAEVITATCYSAYVTYRDFKTKRSAVTNLIKTSLQKNTKKNHFVRSKSRSKRRGKSN